MGHRFGFLGTFGALWFTEGVTIGDANGSLEHPWSTPSREARVLRLLARGDHGALKTKSEKQLQAFHLRANPNLDANGPLEHPLVPPAWGGARARCPLARGGQEAV